VIGVRPERVPEGLRTTAFDGSVRIKPAPARLTGQFSATNNLKDETSVKPLLVIIVEDYEFPIRTPSS